jgi:DNA repair protein RecO (recombination protein O)
VTRSAAVSVHRTDALLLKRIEYGETDLIVSLFTQELGRVSALARGARKSQRRFGGALEPFFTLSVRLEERARSELFVLTEAAIRTPRLKLLDQLSRMDAAGRALSWVRRAAPVRTPEIEAFRHIERLLDRLADRGQVDPEREQAEVGLSLLAAFGWGIDFERCVRCGKPCPEDRPSGVDTALGGLVCTACGGARRRLDAALRKRLARAASGESGALGPEDTRVALDLVDAVFSSHAGIERS